MIKINITSTEHEGGYLCSGDVHFEGTKKQNFHELVSLLLGLYDELPEGMLIDALAEMTAQLAERKGGQ